MATRIRTRTFSVEYEKRLDWRDLNRELHSNFKRYNLFPAFDSVKGKIKGSKIDDLGMLSFTLIKERISPAFLIQCLITIKDAALSLEEENKRISSFNLEVLKKLTSQVYRRKEGRRARNEIIMSTLFPKKTDPLHQKTDPLHLLYILKDHGVIEIEDKEQLPLLPIELKPITKSPEKKIARLEETKRKFKKAIDLGLTQRRLPFEENKKKR